MEDTQSLTNPEVCCMNSLTDKENFVYPQTMQEQQPQEKQKQHNRNLPIAEMTNKTIEQISSKIEEVFSKLQRNLEHNTRVFQEKSQSLLSKIDLAEEQISKVLLQLESVAAPSFKKSKTATSDSEPSATLNAQINEIPIEATATESIALSGDETKLDAADITAEN